MQGESGVRRRLERVGRRKMRRGRGEYLLLGKLVVEKKTGGLDLGLADCADAGLPAWPRYRPRGD